MIDFDINIFHRRCEHNVHYYRNRNLYIEYYITEQTVEIRRDDNPTALSSVFKVLYEPLYEEL